MEHTWLFVYHPLSYCLHTPHSCNAFFTGAHQEIIQFGSVLYVPEIVQFPTITKEAWYNYYYGEGDGT